MLVPGATVDRERWPDGLLPIHTTWSELEDGALGTDIPCVSCHMPPDPDVGNAADLGNEIDPDIGVGIASGWWRPPGAVRRHVWFGPRSDEQRMIDLAAGCRPALTATPPWPGHTTNVARATPSPRRAPPRLLLQVRPLWRRDLATGGDVLPGWAGALDAQEADGDWTRPGAAVGDRIVVVGRAGWHDYAGVGPSGTAPSRPRARARRGGRGAPPSSASGTR